MSAKSSGGGKANQRARDQARAAFMKENPGMFPDSTRRGFTGHGLESGVAAILRGKGF